jgi:hypothetical protein
VPIVTRRVCIIYMISVVDKIVIIYCVRFNTGESDSDKIQYNGIIIEVRILPCSTGIFCYKVNAATITLVGYGVRINIIFLDSRGFEGIGIKIDSILVVGINCIRIKVVIHDLGAHIFGARVVIEIDAILVVRMNRVIINVVVLDARVKKF